MEGIRANFAVYGAKTVVQQLEAFTSTDGKIQKGCQRNLFLRIPNPVPLLCLEECGSEVDQSSEVIWARKFIQCDQQRASVSRLACQAYDINRTNGVLAVWI